MQPGGADDLVSGLVASGKVLGNYFDTQTPEAKQARALEMYKQLMDAESKKALAQNRANKVSKTDVETKGMINQLENSLIQFETALKGIEKYPDTVGGSLKNPSNFVYDVFGLDFGALTGTPEAAIRQQLQKLKVDQQLLSAALTKGAISDREMALFGSDQPKFSSAPNIWRNWLSNRTKLIRKTISNLENNIKVPDPARQETFDKAMKEQQNWLNSLEDDMLFEKQLQGAGAGNTSFSDNVNKALESIKTNP